MNEMNERRAESKRQMTYLGISMLIICCLIVAVFIIIDLAKGVGVSLAVGEGQLFSYKVITGAVLGSVVMLANHIGLTVSVDRAVDNFLKLRGQQVMTEEEAEEFANKHGTAIQNKVRLSYIIRLASMVAALVLAILTKQFDLISTVVPLFMLRPLLFVDELIQKRRKKS